MTEPNLRVGGTLDPRLDVYVDRPQDDKVIQLLLAGEYVAILTSRQMGKSSLVNKASRILAAQGWLTAIVDLTVLGSSSEGTTYYKELMQELARKLPLDIPITPDGIGSTGSPRDLIAFIERLSESAGTSRIAIFLDEIDSTLKLPYTDDLFTSIRAIYNERQVSGKCQNVMFCLIGVAMPDELVKDKRTTPYNIGQNIELDDFNYDRDDLSVLRAALSSDNDVADRLLERILYWTGGQPYLTTKLIASVRKLGPSQASDIDRHIETTYATLESATAQDLHFRYILRFIEERWSVNGEALELYGRILKSHGERDRPSTAHAELKLAGLVKRDRTGMLRVRNRIYSQLFDSEWIARSLPARRLLLYRRTAIFGGLATAGVLAYSVLYRQIKVVPQQEQLQAREILAKLQVSLQVVDQTSWARIPNSDRTVIDQAVFQLGKIFPLGAALGIEFGNIGGLDRDRAGSTAIDLLTAVEPLPRIAGLNLEGSSIDSIVPLTRFAGLKILSLSRLRQVRDFSPLSALTELEQLEVDNTTCSSLEPIRNLPRLINLSISDTPIKDLSPLQPHNLQYFYAGFTPLSDISALSNAAHLVEVGLSKTNIVSISPLADASKLEALFLGETKVRDVEIIERFPALQKLSLNGQIVPRINFLARLDKLRELLLRRVPFDDAEPLSDLLALEKLDLSQTHITSVIGLRSMINLQSLDLSETRIASVAPLSKLTKMTALSLKNTSVSTLEPLAGMRELQYLDLSQCNAVDLNQLRQLPSLRSVALDAGQLERLPRDLQSLAKSQDGPVSSGTIEQYFGFNLGTDARDFRGNLTWWSGPLN